MGNPSPSAALRIGVAIAIGAACGALTFRYIDLRYPPGQAADFTPIYLGAQAVLRQTDPYAAVAARLDVWLHLLFYPLPATLAAAPLTFFSMHVAAGVWLAIGAGWLAYVITRDAWWPLLVFTSGAFWWALIAVQWTPLLIAAALTGPAVGLALVVKPTYTIPLLAMQTRRRNLIAGAAVALLIIGVSLAIQPRWPLVYYRTLRNSPIHDEYVAPAFTLLGAPMWLAALKWRDWRARLVLGMALSPLNAFAYSHMPLLIAARNRFEMMLLCALSWAGYAVSRIVVDRLAPSGHVGYVFLTRPLEPVAIAFYYLPALWLVLRSADSRAPT